MKRAELRLYGMVGAMFGADAGITSEGVAKEIDRVRAEKATGLDIYLSSDGGSVSDGLAVYAQIQRFAGDVTIYVDGRALSIASVIALAGSRLVMPESALMMIHSPFSVSMGTAADFRRQADALDVMAATMRGIYASASGLPEARIQKIMEDETWISAADAKALGFVDEVIPNGRATASAAAPTIALDLYRNTPAALRTVRAEAALAKLEGLLMRQRMSEVARGASAVSGASPGAARTK
jgi:ATP-dependent Clp protease protease subunit